MFNAEMSFITNKNKDNFFLFDKQLIKNKEKISYKLF